MKKIIWIVIVLVVVGAAGLLAYRSLRPEATNKIIVSGNIELTQVDIAFKSSGRLIERDVNEGDPVQKGMVIARLDREQLLHQRDTAEAALSTAEAQLAESKSALRWQQESMQADLQLKNADLNAAQSQLLQLQNGARPQELQQSQAAVAAAQAQYDGAIDGAMTDPKGNRRLAPSDQADPEMFLRVVERKADGIVVRGAKAHQTGAINSHEILVMPTQTMREEDKDYAVSFAVAADAPGILYVYGRQSCDTRRMEGGEIDVGNAVFGGQEALIIFDNVFVPWERVFMCGEYKFSGALVERFAGYHRQSYGGCKSGVGDVLIGAAQAIARIQGTEKVSHIKEKIIEMIHLNETIYACGVACSAEGKPTSSGHLPY